MEHEACQNEEGVNTKRSVIGLAALFRA